MSAPVLSVWTRFPVGLEEGPDGACHVHALNLPGCMSSGSNQRHALDEFGHELRRWLSFLSETGQPIPSRDSELDISVDEWISTDARVAEGDTDVCFAADRIPLSESETLAGIDLLGVLRGRLLRRVRRTTNSQLESFRHEGLTARMVLDELARAQWWTLTRMGASPLAEVPSEVVARLDTSMALAIQQLSRPPIPGHASILLDGEEWTSRKVLRRLLWLEWTLGGATLALMGPEPVRTR